MEQISVADVARRYVEAVEAWRAAFDAMTAAETALAEVAADDPARPPLVERVKGLMGGYLVALEALEAAEEAVDVAIFRRPPKATVAASEGAPS